MTIDHIFIFVNSKEAADELVNFGLTEGSGNIHKGIGTANRRFFFDNFYLEILWVENEDEAKSVEEIGIWERYKYRESGYSRFGICFKNTKETNSIFSKAIQWKPMFLLSNKHVDILTTKHLPWFFRFPPNRRKSLKDEPKKHNVGLKRLSKVVMTIGKMDLYDELKEIEFSTIVKFTEEDKSSLVLEFDNSKNGKVQTFKKFEFSHKILSI